MTNFHVLILHFVQMLVQIVPVAERHFPLFLWVSVASTGPWYPLCCCLPAPSSTMLCAHGWYQLPRFLGRQQHYTKWGFMRFEISLHTKSSIVVIKVSIQVLRMWRDKMSRNDQIHTYVKKKQCSHCGTDISVTFCRTV